VIKVIPNEDFMADKILMKDRNFISNVLFYSGKDDVKMMDVYNHEHMVLINFLKNPETLTMNRKGNNVVYFTF